MAGISVLLLGLAGAAATINTFVDSKHQLAEIQDEVERAKDKRAPSKQGSRAENERAQQDLKHAQIVRDHLLLPWRELFASLEAAKTAEIALLAVEPTGGKREIRVSGEAKNFQAVLSYLDTLGRSSELDNTFLASHQIDVEQPLQPVRFEIVTTWRKRS
jgi:hypothetical protein